jgi:protein TonB
MRHERKEATMFRADTTAWRPQTEAGRRLRVLPAALALHAAALGVMIVGELWAVGPVQEFVSVPPLVVYLPPPPGGGHIAAQPPSQGSAPRRTSLEQVVQPDLVPEGAPRAHNPETPFDGPQVPGIEGLTDGESTGPGIGTGREQVEMDANTTVEPPRRIGGDVQAPVAVSRPAPAYPELARRMRIQGVVRLEAVIDEHGNVVDARVLDDIGMGCGQAAVEAIRTWRYEPATLNGRPVSVYLEVRVSFQLRGNG